MKYYKAHINSVLFIEILKILGENKKLLSSREILNLLRQRDVDCDHKIVKNLLENMVSEGYLSKHDNKFSITKLGIDVLLKSTVFERLDDFVETIQYNLHMATFDLYRMKGSIPVNIAIVDKNKVDDALRAIYKISNSKYVVSNLIQIYDENEGIGDIVIQNGKIGIATISAIVYDIIARNINILIEPYALGLLHYSAFKPEGLVELITYKGITISPGLLFIKSGYTSVYKVAESGEGYTMCDIRNISPHMVKLFERELFLAKARGINDAIAILHPRRLPFDLLIDRKVKIILPTNLNYLAVLQELKFNPEMRINETLIEFSKLKPIENFL